MFRIVSRDTAERDIRYHYVERAGNQRGLLERGLMHGSGLVELFGNPCGKCVLVENRDIRGPSHALRHHPDEGAGASGRVEDSPVLEPEVVENPEYPLDNGMGSGVFKPLKGFALSGLPLLLRQGFLYQVGLYLPALLGVFFERVLHSGPPGVAGENLLLLLGRPSTFALNLFQHGYRGQVVRQPCREGLPVRVFGLGEGVVQGWGNGNLPAGSLGTSFSLGSFHVLLSAISFAILRAIPLF